MHYSIQDFIQLIAQLRNPNGGCPWDLKQNYELRALLRSFGVMIRLPSSARSPLTT